LVWTPQPRPPSEVEVVIAWHEALNDRDLDRLVSLCSDDVEFGGPGGSGHGPELLREWFASSGLDLELGAFLQRGEVVVVSQEAQWTSPGGAGAVENVASVFRVREGRIVSIIRYPDLDAALIGAGIMRRREEG
jgi:ketosteroid isomerase-like protein